MNNSQNFEKIVLMDIDGVLCPTYPVPEDVESVLIPENRLARWQMRENVVDLLSDLVFAPRVRLLWASAWEDCSEIIPESLGLPLDSFEFLHFPTDYMTTFSMDWWKIPTVLSFLDEAAEGVSPRNGLPVLWIDDDMTEKAQRMALERQVDFIRPVSEDGLTDDLVDKVREWCGESLNVDND